MEMSYGEGGKGGDFLLAMGIRRILIWREKSKNDLPWNAWS